MNFNDFQNFKNIGEINLVDTLTADQRQTVGISILLNPRDEQVYLVDYAQNRYRVGSSTAKLGDWMEFKGSLKATG